MCQAEVLRIGSIRDEYHLGNIGSIGPESTIEYYRTLVRCTARAGDGSYPATITNALI
jgi:aspartate/glutamate racemase